MERIAFTVGNTFLYWNSLIIAAGVAVTILMFLAFYLNRTGDAVAAFAVVPVAMVLGIVCARFVHWYSRADSYDGFLAAMTDYSSGGYALLGVFVGCIAAAGITRLLQLHRNLPQMLDCMAIAACAGLAVGRLNAFYVSADRGQVVQGFTGLPLTYPVVNNLSGALEYRFATFLFQALVCLVLFGVLTSFYTAGGIRRRPRDGDTALLFCMIYGGSQVVLDSTRYDSLFFRSNGFVSIVQVMGAVALVFGLVVFSRRLVREKGMRWWYVPLWIVLLAALVGAGVMEWYVQRRGNEALFAYSVMSACLLLAIGLGLAQRKLAKME